MLLGFNHLFAGLEAYVSAHLTDFPRDLQLQAVPGGVGASVSIPFRAPMNAAPIGIFDSGIGGLTVARADLRAPAARVHRLLRRHGPGALRPQVARDGARYSLEILDWLLEQGVKAVVIACNTSTAHALEALQAAVAGAGDRRDRARRARGGRGVGGGARSA